MQKKSSRMASRKVAMLRGSTESTSCPQMRAQTIKSAGENLKDGRDVSTERTSEEKEARGDG